MKDNPVQQSCLLVARDAAAWRATFDAFAAYGVAVTFADDLESARTALQSAHPAVVLLDAEGLGADHVALLRGLVAEADVPIVALLDPSDEVGQIMALEVGATDVINRMSSPRLLLARLNRLTWAITAALAPGTHVVAGELRLDSAAREARAGNTMLALTAGEFDVLFALGSHAERPVSRDTIARALGRGTGGRSVDMTVCRLRRKLRDAGVTTVRIRTSYGRGYVLCVERRPVPSNAAPSAGGTRWETSAGTRSMRDRYALPA